MSKIVKVRNVSLGEGGPKLCVPIMGATREALLTEAAGVKLLPLDLVEWRADFFSGVQEPGRAVAMLGELREALGEIPILFTVRTRREHGELDIADEAYARLNMEVARSRKADLIDVELFTQPSVLRLLMAGIHACGVKIIMSNHDFDATPPCSELVNRLRKMRSWGADIVKIAVMPHTPDDVLALLEATREAAKDGKSPVVSMAMGGLGVITRLAGEIFGSALTFGAADKASAPGQISAGELRHILNILHESLSPSAQ